MTPDQIKMAMAVLELSVRDLANATNLAPGTIMRMKYGEGTVLGNREIVRAYLLEQGIDFIDCTDTHESTVAVRRIL